ncbi:amidohydrolase family protein [Novosphingobium malaysiense]|nr:amidohydrolase family protein [Novosphingobium malaysiense]
MNDMVLISVDDHIIEPPDMFETQLKGDVLASAPQHKETPDGTNYWEYQGMIIPYVGIGAVTGRPPEEYGMEPTNLAQHRRGHWDVHARIADMDVNGIAASLNYPQMAGFDGGLFQKAKDKDAALIHLRAYNDWHLDVWCGAYPGRMIPNALLPTWNMEETVAEIKRQAAKGVTSVSLNDNPTKAGLPSIHNEYWNPMFKALADHDMVINLHIGAGNPAPHASDETPIEAWITTMPMSVNVGMADWLYLKALRDYPTLKICVSEGGLGWVPYLMERADYANWRHKAWTHIDFGNDKPSDIFKRHFMICFVDDIFGLKHLEDLNEDMVAYECDYPHSDCLWPEVPEYLWRSVKHLTDVQIDKITHGNVMRHYNFDLFSHFKREEITVGALREKARLAGVDTTPVSYGGVKPTENPRVVTSGDIARMVMSQQKAEEPA